MIASPLFECLAWTAHRNPKPRTIPLAIPDPTPAPSQGSCPLPNRRVRGQVPPNPNPQLCVVRGVVNANITDANAALVDRRTRVCERQTV
jgi:hypothetical protein